MTIEEFVESIGGGKLLSSGVYSARCPAHRDRNPSLSVASGEDGRILFKCHAGCSFEDVVNATGYEAKDFFPSPKNPYESQATTEHTELRVNKMEISAEKVESLHGELTPHIRSLLSADRQLAEWVVEKYQLGLQRNGKELRITIPIKDKQGRFVDIRRWLPREQRINESIPKILHWESGFGGARLYPIEMLESEQLVLCEGELDALALISNGINAVTITAGATTSLSESQLEMFRGKKISILMDNDEAGRTGSVKRFEQLKNVSKTISTVQWPETRGKGWDVTDEIREYGIISVRKMIDNSEHSNNLLSINNEEWPDVEEIVKPNQRVMAFEEEMLPESLRPWVIDISERMQCPVDFVAVGAMVSLAAVVGRQVGMRPMRHDDWEVVPNLWGAIIGRPGVLKTPALNEALLPIKKLESMARSAHEIEEQQFEIDEIVNRALKKKRELDLEKKVKRGLDAYKEALDLNSINEIPPKRKRYLCNDTTVEKLGEILGDNNRGILIFRDELTGFLKNLDKEGREGDRAFYLECWNGNGEFTYDRIGRGTIEIKSCCVSILGGIQPGPISSYLKRMFKGGGDDDGLIQRFQLVVWPDVPERWNDIDRKPDNDARAVAESVYERLENIQVKELGFVEPELTNSLPYIRFDDEAQVKFIQWRERLEERIRSGKEQPIFEAHLAKFRSLIPSVALLCHLADNDSGPVTVGSLERSLRWGQYLETHAKKLYGLVLEPEVDNVDALVDKVKSRHIESPFTLRDVYGKCWAMLDTRDKVMDATAVLENAKWLKKVVESTPGRPKVSFQINPKIFSNGI